MIKVLFKTRGSGNSDEAGETIPVDPPMLFPSLAKLCEALSSPRTPKDHGVFILPSGDQWKEGRWAVVIRDEPDDADGPFTMYGVEERVRR